MSMSMFVQTEVKKRSHRQVAGQGLACQVPWLPWRVTWGPGDPLAAPPTPRAYLQQPAGQAWGCSGLARDSPLQQGSGLLGGPGTKSRAAETHLGF